MAGKEIAVKKYVVRLTTDERERLETLTRAGKNSAQLLTKARILLKADVSEGGRVGATARSRRRWTPVSPILVAPGGNSSRKGSRRR